MMLQSYRKPMRIRYSPLWYHFTFIVSAIKLAICSFLVSPRKERKEGDLKGAECRAPARQSRPFKKSPARTWQHSTLYRSKFDGFSNLSDGGSFALPALPGSVLNGRYFNHRRRRYHSSSLHTPNSSLTYRQELIFAVLSRILFCILVSPFFRATSTLRMA